MTLLYTHRCFLKHETGDHPERPDRIRGLEDHLDQSGLLDRCTVCEPVAVTPNRLARIHSPDYITEIWSSTKMGGGHIEADTVVSPESYDIALMAAGSTCDAVDRILRGEDTTALCPVRPPGHHAVLNRAMGFCLFNNVAIAARAAIDDHELDRVLIVDFDIHHGNGTQAAFWDDPRVGFFSIHRWPFYPGTGDEDETGTGDGLGTTLNLPVELGISRDDYLKLFADRLEQFATKLRPQLILVSAGFDTHHADPVGNLGLETEDFTPISRVIMEAAATHADGRVVTVLEGGYVPQIVAEGLALHLEELLGDEPA
jgi:acetoin utilization deacetylase AcuC-like enzyme